MFLFLTWWILIKFMNCIISQLTVQIKNIEYERGYTVDEVRKKVKLPMIRHD